VPAARADRPGPGAADSPAARSSAARSPNVDSSAAAGSLDSSAAAGPPGGREWQVRFDGGHQQRYLPDRAAVLRYVLAIAPRAGSGKFEVFAESEPVTLADGTPGGRAFGLTEVIDFSRPGEEQRLRAELEKLPGPGGDPP
jgi:hypothetical protein